MRVGVYPVIICLFLIINYNAEVLAAPAFIDVIKIRSKYFLSLVVRWTSQKN